MNRTIKATGICLVCCLFPLKVNAGSLDFSQLIVLGDSLSDTGNVFSATDRIVPPEMLGENLAYFDGRFTNGANWIDSLAEDLRLVTPTPIVDVFLNGTVPQGGLNLAFGGATTEAANTVDPKLAALQDVSDSQPGQISLLSNFASLVDSKALHILWFGANDYLPTTSPDFVPFETPESTVNNIANALTRLVELGATDILVPNLPLLGSLPRANNLDPFFPMVPIDTAEQLNLLTIEHNQLLSTTLEDLSIKFGTQVNLIPLEIDLLFNQTITEFINSPDESPFTNITDVCLLNSDCINPDQFLFWDGIHPTSKTHELIAEFAFKTLLQQNPQAVPEPDLNWQLLILASFLFLSARIKYPIAR